MGLTYGDHYFLEALTRRAQARSTAGGGTDAGIGGTDAGIGGTDAGIGGTDAGAGGTGGGGAGASGPVSGSGCATGGSSALAFLAAAFMALRTRRRGHR